MENKYFQISTNFFQSVQVGTFRANIGKDYERAEIILLALICEIMKKGGLLKLTTLNPEVCMFAVMNEIPQSEVWNIIHTAVESRVFRKDKFEQNILQPCELLARTGGKENAKVQN